MANLLKVSYVLFGIYSSLVSVVMHRKQGSNRIRLWISFSLLVTLLIAILLIMQKGMIDYLDLLGENNAFFAVDLESIFSVAFFFIVSAITSVEFGITQALKDRIESRLEVVEARLALGRAVQELLLPQQMAGSALHYRYSFTYEPAEEMAGDWLGYWKVNDNEVRIFIGDVTGKGPQAALAVSAIASVIDECKQEATSIKECLGKINLRLQRLFNGRVGTTLSVVAIRSDSTCDLYNCGAAGWILVNNERDLKFLPLRSSALGTSSALRIAHAEVYLSPDTILCSFTDGVMEGSRALKNLQRLLRGCDGNLDFCRLKEMLFAAGEGRVLDDDRTIVMLKVPSAQIYASQPS